MGKKGLKRTRGRPSTGSAMTAAERMRRLRERRKAAGLKPVVAWVPEERAEQPTYSSHRLLEARSLAMHAVIARKIERDPTLLEIAHRNIERWSARWKDGPPAWLKEWQEVLKQPWQLVAAIITEPSEHGARVRQSSPFAGVLTNEERWRIYEAFRA
jgi:Protein  of unknown function (DUF3018)